MSAAVSPVQPDPEQSSSREPRRAAETEPAPVVVRRNAGVAALIGAAASAVAIAYLWRATQSGAPLDWALCVVLAAIAAVHLAHLVDARTPLLVADRLGVRVRLGNHWRGLPWDAVAEVVVTPSHGPVKDGRLMFVPHSLSRALDGVDARGRRAAALNQRMYGAALAVPLGLTTRVSARGPALTDRLSTLASGRADVVVVRASVPEPTLTDAAGPAALSDLADSPEPTADRRTDHPVDRPVGPVDRRADEPVDEPVDDPADRIGDQPADRPADRSAGSPKDRPGRRSLIGGLGTVVSRVAKGRGRDVDSGEEPADEPSGPSRPLVPAARAASPLRATRHALRAEITRDTPATVLGSAALLPGDDGHPRRTLLPEHRELRRPDGLEVADRVGDGRVQPISTLGEPVEPLVVDDYVTEPAYDPVIGPELAAARTRVGLSVDELAERTRIRPHVIESIEVDDFAPCGGDFYARGHLRTLARVLGRDAAPLLEQFDSRYATAPVSARRVFEAELATGIPGSTRSTVGGPNWALLVGVVLALVLTWGVVRLFASEPPEVLQPAPVLNGSAGLADPQGPRVARAPVPTPAAVRVRLTGSRAGSLVVVRDRSAKVVWAGELLAGQERTIRATPPVRVQADDGGAIAVAVSGSDQGTVGALGVRSHRTFTRPDAR